MLQDFITGNREEIIARCREKVAARPAPSATPAELEHGVPFFLDQLGDILRSETQSSPGIRASAARHGEEMLRQGFTVGQVVHDYGDICQTITDLALEKTAPISTADFRRSQPCLDDAIANAVTGYGDLRDARISAKETERLGIFAHELRNLLNAAVLSFEVLKTGKVGFGGRRRDPRPNLSGCTLSSTARPGRSRLNAAFRIARDRDSQLRRRSRGICRNGGRARMGFA